MVSSALMADCAVGSRRVSKPPVGFEAGAGAGQGRRESYEREKKRARRENCSMSPHVVQPIEQDCSDASRHRVGPIAMRTDGDVEHNRAQVAGSMFSRAEGHAPASCPHCSRVFASQLGVSLHIPHCKLSCSSPIVHPHAARGAGA